VQVLPLYFLLLTALFYHTGAGTLFPYPSRFVSRRTLTLHLRALHFEQRIRLTTSTSSASQPANCASDCGFAVRVWPQVQLMVRTYCPKWSPSFTTLMGGRGGIIALET
jgi:hypothetical protein